MLPRAPGRLRIAYVADTLDALGGGVVAAARMVVALRERHDVVVVSATAGEPGDVRLPSFRLPVHAMREQRFLFARPSRDVLVAALRGVDVVHLQYPFWLSFAALKAAQKLGVPTIAAFHVQPENLLWSVGVHWHWLRNLLYHLWIRHLYGRADAVVCPSRFAARTLRAHGLTVPTYVVSNGTSPRYRRHLAERDPGWRGCFVILMVGRLAHEKRHDLLLEAVARSRHRERIRLVFAGGGPLAEKLRGTTAGLAQPPVVGFVSDEELDRLYNTADLLVHASEVELEGMSVLEAASCALPALIADAPDSAAPQFAVSPEFLFRAGDADDLAARLDRIVEHPELLAWAREQAYTGARAFAFESCVQRLEGVYAQVVERQRAPMLPSRRTDDRLLGY